MGAATYADTAASAVSPVKMFEGDVAMLLHRRGALDGERRRAELPLMNRACS
jgi:hypothetical protein